MHVVVDDLEYVKQTFVVVCLCPQSRCFSAKIHTRLMFTFCIWLYLYHSIFLFSLFLIQPTIQAMAPCKSIKDLWRNGYTAAAPACITMPEMCHQPTKVAISSYANTQSKGLSIANDYDGIFT